RTQSGKSTLIEHLKKYADPGYTVNMKNARDSTFSLTKNVIATEIHTNSPAYYIKSPKNNQRVDYGEFINEANIAIIFKALASIESVNLVAIMVSNNPFTEGLMEALKAYIELLPEFNGNIIFVHTKIDYAKLHPEDDTQFANSLNEKKKLLARLVSCDSIPHILINNAIGTKQVVCNCLTQNTLRNLLSMAKLNQLTEKMRYVDLILRDKYEVSIKVHLETLGTKAEIAKKEALLEKSQEYLRVSNNDTLELLHEELYQQDFSILNVMESSKSMYYPGKKRAAKHGFIHHVLNHIDFHMQNIKVLQEASSKGEKFWAIKFHWRKHQNGIYHIKIYITRKKKFAMEIENIETQVILLEEQLGDLRHDLQHYEAMTAHLSYDMKEFLDGLNLDIHLLGRVCSIQLDGTVFHKLVEAGVYVHNLAQSAKNVEAFYIAMRDVLEKPESGAKYGVPDPANISKVYDTGNSEIFEVPDARHISRPLTPEMPFSPQQDLKCSVLMFGKTQSGKTKFIEFVKKYVDPQYNIKWELIGNGIVSKTGELEQFVVDSGVPKYQVYHNNDVTKTPINLSIFANSYDDPNEYFDALHCQKTTLHLVTFLDTPGIEDTNRQDEKHAQAIIEKIIELHTVNLIIVNVNCMSTTLKCQELAFNYYSKVIQMLQGHHSNVIFLYMHAKYEHCHHSNKDHLNMAKRHETFSNYFRGFKKTPAQEGSSMDAHSKTDTKPFPMYTIDMCENHQPIPDCMMKNTLKDVIKLVLASPSICLDMSDENLK
ncbi:hypothetical protein CPB97_003818, partial [Podila verticillata]